MCPEGPRDQTKYHVSRGQIAFRGHACDSTYSVVDDIRNQFIIGTKKVVIFVIRKLVLDFSIRFFNFQKMPAKKTLIQRPF